MFVKPKVPNSSRYSRMNNKNSSWKAISKNGETSREKMIIHNEKDPGFNMIRNEVLIKNL